MSAYNPPTTVSSIFNVADFTDDNDDPLTISEGDLRYIKKLGDNVTGNIIFSGLNIYNNTSTFNAQLKVKETDVNIYDSGNNIIGYLNSSGEILTTQLNNVTDTQITYLENITSDVQTQIEDSITDVTDLENKTSDI